MKKLSSNRLLNVILIVLISVQVIRWINNKRLTGEERKLHAIERYGYDNFIYNLLRFLPDEASSYSDKIVFQNEKISLYESKIDNKSLLIFEDRETKDLKTLYPHVSDEFIDIVIDMKNGQAITYDMPLTLMNIEVLNQIIEEKGLLTKNQVVREFVSVKSGISDEDIIESIATLGNKNLGSLISYYLSTHSTFGDTAVYTIRHDSTQLCRYDFDIENNEIINIQFVCVDSETSSE